MVLAPRSSPARSCFPGNRWTCSRAWRKSTFDVGAKVILQAPASFRLESGTSARLEMGKATTEITTAAARGFKIRTPQATFVDQGTEFGVEVSPGGSSRVHVFKGCVDVAVNGDGRQGAAGLAAAAWKTPGPAWRETRRR